MTQSYPPSLYFLLPGHISPCLLYSLPAVTTKVELLLKNGVDADAHDNGEGLTPLMWAAQLG